LFRSTPSGLILAIRASTAGSRCGRSREASTPFGFNASILVDKSNRIVAGHGRYEAAQLLGLDRLPVISLDHLTDAQARAYLLADNKLAERSSWDDASLALQLKELVDLALDFDFEAIGFELPEVDLRIQSLDPEDNADRADEFSTAVGPPCPFLARRA
jgi:ParB-like chromosome segregation protein Spo0J